MPVQVYLGLILAVMAAAGLTVAVMVWSGWSLAVLGLVAAVGALVLRGRG